MHSSNKSSLSPIAFMFSIQLFPISLNVVSFANMMSDHVHRHHDILARPSGFDFCAPVSRCTKAHYRPLKHRSRSHLTR